MIFLCEKLKSGLAANIIARQLIRCSTSVGANYRAACRAKSPADFLNKLKIVEEEADETLYFLELLKEIDKNNLKEITKIYNESNEILAITVASIKTVRNKTTKK